MAKRRTALLVCMVFVYMLPIKSQSLIELCDRYGMETPVIRSEFPDRYLERNLNFTMTAGVERTPGGRIWNCAFGGEDGQIDTEYLAMLLSDAVLGVFFHPADLLGGNFDGGKEPLLLSRAESRQLPPFHQLTHS